MQTDEPMIVHESRDWLAISKPSGFHTLRPGKRAKANRVASESGHGADNGDDAATAFNSRSNVESWLAVHRPELRELPECGLVYRLDELTSGCLIAARSAAMLEHLVIQWRHNESIMKEYLAVVEPGPHATSGKFARYFTSRYRRSRKVTVREYGEQRELGRCAWTKLDLKAADGLSVLCVRLIGPGRRHQIRAGLAFDRMPIAGDVLYGGRSPWRGGFGLHAWRMTIEGETIAVNPPARWEVPRVAMS